MPSSERGSARRQQASRPRHVAQGARRLPRPTTRGHTRTGRISPCTSAGKCAYEADERRERSVSLQFIVETRRQSLWIAQFVQRQPESLGARPNGKKQLVEQTPKFRTVAHGQFDAERNRSQA